jgi:hypothetical protein
MRWSMVDGLSTRRRLARGRFDSPGSSCSECSTLLCSSRLVCECLGCGRGTKNVFGSVSNLTDLSFGSSMSDTLMLISAADSDLPAAVEGVSARACPDTCPWAWTSRLMFGDVKPIGWVWAPASREPGWERVEAQKAGDGGMCDAD